MENPERSIPLREPRGPSKVPPLTAMTSLDRLSEVWPELVIRKARELEVIFYKIIIKNKLIEGHLRRQNALQNNAFGGWRTYHRRGFNGAVGDLLQGASAILYRHWRRRNRSNRRDSAR